MSMCECTKMTMQWKNTGSSLCHRCRDGYTKALPWLGVHLLHMNCFENLHIHSCSNYEVTQLNFSERKPNLCYGCGWERDTCHLTQRRWFAFSSCAGLSHGNFVWTKCARGVRVLREARGLSRSGTSPCDMTCIFFFFHSSAKHSKTYSGPQTSMPCSYTASSLFMLFTQ